MNLILHDSGLVNGSGGGGGSQVGELKVVNLDFIDNNKIVKLRSITAFTMWQDAVNGDWTKIHEYVGWARALGITDFIIFGCWGNTNWNPLKESGAYEMLVNLDNYVNSQGGRLYLVVFTDQVPNSPVLMNKAEQDTHLTSSLFAMKVNKTGRVSFVNEYRKNWQEPYPIPYNPSIFDGLVAEWSTWYDGHDPQEPGPYLKFANKHTGGFDDEWSRKSKVLAEAQRGLGGGLGQYPPTNRPTVVRERCRVAERSTPTEHAVSTALEEGMGSGGNIHGGFHAHQHDSLLQRCMVPTGLALECVVAATKCYDILPDWLASRGNYGNSGGGVIEHDDNRMLRTYVMFEDDNAAWVFRVKGKKGGMPIIVKNDWRIMDKFGYDEEVLYCTR